MAEKHKIVERLRAQLTLGAGLRSMANAGGNGMRWPLRRWQSERLARTHGDLLEVPRYHAAAVFFLNDLYGPVDLSKRYAETERVMPLIVAMLPSAGLEAVANAVELDALSESLDADMADVLASEFGRLDEATYCAAYRRIGRRADRATQIRLIRDLGLALDHLSQVPLVRGALRKMRIPARIVGLGELQQFLERGFESFNAMNGAAEFVTTIVRRETALSEALFAGNDRLLGVPAVAWKAAKALAES